MKQPMTNAGSAREGLPAGGCAVHIVEARKSDSAGNEALRATPDAWAQDGRLEVKGATLPWRVYPGLFAGGGLGMVIFGLVTHAPLWAQISFANDLYGK
jgi:hypothetical protein